VLARGRILHLCACSQDFVLYDAMKAIVFFANDYHTSERPCPFQEQQVFDGKTAASHRQVKEKEQHHGQAIEGKEGTARKSRETAQGRIRQRFRKKFSPPATRAQAPLPPTDLAVKRYTSLFFQFDKAPAAIHLPTDGKGCGVLEREQ